MSAHPGAVRYSISHENRSGILEERQFHLFPQQPEQARTRGKLKKA